MNTIIQEIQATPAARQWEKVGTGSHHGICLPLFSLHSASSAGIGEFTDLLPLLRWCSEIGLDVIQLLPLNDTGLETSPYSALSALALNPIHLGLAALPHVGQTSMLQAILRDAQKLNSSQRINYPQVHRLKNIFLREYFRLYGEEIANSEAYTTFVSENSWLPTYGLFKAIKEGNHWQSWDHWPKHLKNALHEAMLDLYTHYEVDIAFHQCIQYLCFQQMEEVKAKANAMGILLKGDIPILLNYESVDVWQHPDLFETNFSAGAPPDQYAELGQNWGFPLYNWAGMEKQGFAWWKKRLAVAEHFYDLYRLDHVVGFYRIWGIPKSEKAYDGSFFPPNPDCWIEQGEKILTTFLKSSQMLPIAEDLGTVPTEIRESLTRLGICGTKVMRWERLWEEDESFIIPENYPHLSMTTVSTHDSSPLALWWKENDKESQAYARQRHWRYYTELPDSQHFAILYDSHHTPSRFHINLLNEYLALFPELIWHPLEAECINVPGIVSDSNWTYRFRPSVEEIIAHTLLAELIQDLKK